MLQRLTDFNLAQLHVSPDAEVAIVLVDEGAMEALHVQWMDEPGPTDVLSFPMTSCVPEPRTVRRLPACSATSCSARRWPRRRRRPAGHTLMDELILLTTHGLLHLLGFDHAEPDEERGDVRAAEGADPGLRRS